METFAINSTEQYLLMAAGILLAVQIIYYLVLYSRIGRRNRKEQRNELHFTQELPPLSVIICAHDEVENLRRNLPAILAQDYPDFEVIVINDGEKNESEDYLLQLEEQYRNLYHSFVPDSSRYISRKKLAVTLGIRASRHDWLVLTEANCQPQSNQWLRLMARNFTPHTGVVLGYSGYERGKAGFTAALLSTACSPPCAIWDLPWADIRIWASGETWLTENSSSTTKKDFLPI